tara:strand:+ start:156 stop:671 length:516 start_codon:yes stop_codon:yes gene_type:complete
MLETGKEVWRNENPNCRARYNGQQAEESFSAVCLRRGWHVYSPKVDEGVDFIVETQSGGMKKVQVTRGSQHNQASAGKYNINKSWSKVRKDIDIIAILCEEETETGVVQHWFIVPAECFISAGFDKYYNTDGTWYLNINEPKPPMDAALNAWWLFNRKNVNGKRILKTFLP